MLGFAFFAKAQTTVDPKKDTTIYTTPDVPAEYPGGMDALYKFIAENLVYPQSAKTSNVQGKVYVGFVIEKKGNLSGVKVVRGLTKDVNAEAVRVIKDAPRWAPAKQGANAVRQEFMVPISFNIKEDATAEVFEPVDESAEYPGGMEAFLTYITKKLNYPKQARLDRVNGKVQLSFVVEKNGIVSNVKILKSLTPETDAEAIRLIKGSKEWKPAKIRGNPARQKFTQAITFSPPEE
ncbi:hypothetical protein GCM10028827_18370 [Mucilaginibacter myungsuensis]